MATQLPSLDKLESYAAGQFPQDKFVRVPDVCVFKAHQHGRTPAGDEQDYSADDLQAIVDQLNYEIANTGDFAVLSDGHTPTPEQKAGGMKAPPVLGYQGPYRLGTIGKLNPQPAIVAHEWRYKDKAEDVSRKPKRSVEMLFDRQTDKPYGWRTVAALGSESPRLAVGMSFEHDKDSIVRYQAEVAAAPAGGNTFIPGETKKKSPSREVHMALTPEDNKQLIDALSETDVWKWAKQKMAEDKAEDEEPEVDHEAEEDAADMEGMGEKEKKEYMARCAAEEASKKEEEEKKKKEAEAEPVHHAASEPVRYAALRRETAELRRKLQRVEAEQESRRRVSVDEARDATIERYAMQYPIDIDEERKACLHREGSKLSDDQFQDRMALIVRYAAPLSDNRIPRGEARRSEPKGPTKQQSDEAVRYAAQYQREHRGQRLSFDDALAHVMQNGAAV